MYREYDIEKFLSELASTKSMPGGGVASALLAATGVSLALKVCNLSLGKEKYKQYEKLILSAKSGLTDYNKLFLEFMDEDAKNFKMMEAVYKMNRNTEEEKKDRKIALTKACENCCIVPEKIAKNSLLAIDAINKIDKRSNQSAASDLNIAKEFLKTSAIAAWENIEVNLKYIEDNDFKNKFNELFETINKLKEA